MEGQGVSTEALGVIITFASGLAKMTQAGFGERIGKPGAMLLALGYSAAGVFLWAYSQPTLPDRLWIFGLGQAIVICSLSCIGVFSAAGAVADIATRKLQREEDADDPAVERRTARARRSDTGDGS